MCTGTSGGSGCPGTARSPAGCVRAEVASHHEVDRGTRSATLEAEPWLDGVPATAGDRPGAAPATWPPASARGCAAADGVTARRLETRACPSGSTPGDHSVRRGGGGHKCAGSVGSVREGDVTRVVASMQRTTTAAATRTTILHREIAWT